MNANAHPFYVHCIAQRSRNKLPGFIINLNPENPDSKEKTMPYIKTIPNIEADGQLAELYQRITKTVGYLPNHAKIFSLRPKVYEAWLNLQDAIRANMRLRRYELVTFATSQELGCSYCMLAHGTILHKNFFSVDEMLSIVKDFRNAGLTAEEVTLMAFAKKIIKKAGDVTEEDVQELRGFGLSDEEILDIVLVTDMRAFFSKTIDTLGADPDDVYKELDPKLIEAFAIGRPFPPTG
jgi:uncharacterized peroxidase-related enzyme